MVQTSTAPKNLWVAASDGDLDRVRYLIENEHLSPNAKDPNSYTPMHAAASYDHLELLEYLISIGGDINISDDDGETPIFTVESLEMARWMVDHGADVQITNQEGLTPSEYLEEDHPEVAAYLSSLHSSGSGNVPQPTPTNLHDPAVSLLAVDDYTSRQTSSLLLETKRIMEESERDGTDPDERLREVVERAVSNGMSFGGQIGAAVRDSVITAMDEEKKRTRVDGT